MKITLRPRGAVDDSTDVVLADGADRAEDNARGPATASNSVSILVQSIPAIGAANSKHESRGNRSGRYAFRASRRFSSLDSAGMFMLLHGMECPAEGTLIFEFDPAADQPRILLFGCALEQIGEMEQIGVTVKTRYSALYGDAAEVLPAYISQEIADYYG